MPARLLRDPLTIFLIAGVALFVSYSYLDNANSPPVKLTRETRDLLAENFAAMTGREPSQAEAARLEQDYLTDELLFRDAINQGLHLSNSKIRGELIEQMRMQITGMLPEATGEALVNHYAENMPSYYSEPAVSFTQVFFNTLPKDAQSLPARLDAGEAVSGDAYWQGNDFPGYGHSMIRGMFGQEFLDALSQATLNNWHGPLRSARGWHFVKPTRQHTPRLLPFEQVRSQVENDYLVAVITAAVARRSAELEARYGVEIEP